MGDTRENKAIIPIIKTYAMTFIKHDIVAEPVIGLRMWKIKPTGQLYSYIRNYRWGAGTLEAACTSYGSVKNHQSEGGNNVLYCCCGFWSMKYTDNLCPYGLGYRKDMAWGEIEMWGVIIEGDLGYRTQFARIKNVWIPNEQADLKKKIKKIYKIPVEVSEWKLGSPLEQLKLPHL